MKTTITTCLLLTSLAAGAQSITFDKKSGDFSSPSGVVAKLNSERVKAGKFSLGMGVGKNFYVTDAAGTNEYVGYLLQRFEDTLGSPTVWYYTLRCTPLGLTASDGEMTGTFKEVGETVVSKNLIQADGKINEAATRDYFKSLQGKYSDMPAMLKSRNDSLVQLITVTAQPEVRDLSKPIIANEFGKIGQDNKVIGYWELVVTPPKNGIGSNEYHYVIRNLNNGIACMVWLSLGGADLKIFDHGKRTDDRIAPSLQENPIEQKYSFLPKVAAILVRKGLL